MIPIPKDLADKLKADINKTSLNEKLISESKDMLLELIKNRTNK